MNAVFFVRYMKLILPSKYHASILWVWIFSGGACSFIHLLLIRTLWIVRIFQTILLTYHRIRKRIPNFIWQKIFANQEQLCLYIFFVKTIWLVKNFVKIGLLFQRGFEPTVARLVGSFFWWSLYKAKEWPEYNTSIACSIIREFFTLLFGAVHKLCRLAKGHLISKAIYGLPTSSKKRTDLICLPWRVKKQTNQIRPFVFWEKLADHKLVSRLTDL